MESIDHASMSVADTDVVMTDYNSSFSDSTRNLQTAENTPSTTTICPLLNERAFECPICLDLLCEPVTLSCGHTYCQECITQFVVTSHSFSKTRRRRRTCRCPSCKAYIPDTLTPFTVSYTLRDFLRNQFTQNYHTRYTESEPARIKWNHKLRQLRQQRDEERKAMQRCCGIRRAQQWMEHNMELLANPQLNGSTRSWLLRWFVLYCVLLSILVPITVPLLEQWNRSYSANGNGLQLRFSLDFMDEWLEYFGLNAIWRVSTMSFGASVMHLFHCMLQWFGAIVPIKNMAYLPEHYVNVDSNAMSMYNQFGDLYASNSTELYYKSLFHHWTSRELKTFVKRHDIRNSCFERQCYTDTIVQYLKEEEWNKLVDTEPVPVRILQNYLNHYEMDYADCYAHFWSKDDDCLRRKAASVKIVNDVYYQKKALLSIRSMKPPRMSEPRISKKHKSKQEPQHRQNEHSDRRYQYHSHHENRHRNEHHFGFEDIGNMAFNILSKLR